jgi:hypothetical protein
MSIRTAKLFSDEVSYLTALVRADLQKRAPGADEHRDRMALYSLLGLGVPDDEADRLLAASRLILRPGGGVLP